LSSDDTESSSLEVVSVGGVPSIGALKLESEWVSCCDVEKADGPPEFRSRRTEVVVLSGRDATMEQRTRPPCISSGFTVVVVGGGIMKECVQRNIGVGEVVWKDVDKGRLG
jgi:hypothetical protein